MKGLVGFIGLTVGGWVGWFLGAQISFFTRFVVSMVGTGAGLYYTRRALRDLLP